MKYLRIPSQPYELWNKTKTVVKYFLFGENLARKVKMHLEVIKTLNPYRRKNLIAFRAYFTYILPYISKSLSVIQRHHILINHYTLLRQYFSPAQLDQLFKNGIECYREADNEDVYSINLQAVTNHLEFEGSMYLLFKINQVNLFTLSFTFVPGSVFGQHNKVIIYISAIQGTKNEFENIKKATKYFKDIAIPAILLKVLEVIAENIHIDKCIGIAGKNQLSFKDDSAVGRFNEIYDQFWINSGGVLSNHSYVIDLPLTGKPINLINQNHRNRTIRKRKKLKEIYISVSKNMRLLLQQNGAHV